MILGWHPSTAIPIAQNVKALKCPEKAKHLAKTTAENVIFASFVRLVICDKLLRIVKNASTAMVPLQMNSLTTVLGSAKLVCEYVSSADSDVVIEIEINNDFQITIDSNIFHLVNHKSEGASVYLFSIIFP